jgi:hypothetical protein
MDLHQHSQLLSRRVAEEEEHISILQEILEDLVEDLEHLLQQQQFLVHLEIGKLIPQHLHRITVQAAAEALVVLAPLVLPAVTLDLAV